MKSTKIAKKNILSFNSEDEKTIIASIIGEFDNNSVGKPIKNPFRADMYCGKDNCLYESKYVCVVQAYRVHQRDGAIHSVIRLRKMTKMERKQFKLFRKQSKRNYIRSFRFYD